LVDDFLAGKQHPPLWLACPTFESASWPPGVSKAESSAQVSADSPAILAPLTVFHSQSAAPRLADVLTSTSAAGWLLPLVDDVFTALQGALSVQHRRFESLPGLVSLTRRNSPDPAPAPSPIGTVARLASGSGDPRACLVVAAAGRPRMHLNAKSPDSGFNSLSLGSLPGHSHCP
jgi:hypothetical protein